MNLSALPELLLAWVKTQGASALQGSRGESGAAFQAGATYEGKVLDQLASGRHLVQVAGQKLDMALPRDTQSGDNVRLTFMHAGPRPTFLLNPPSVTPTQQVQISSAAQQVSALMRLSPAPSIQAPVQVMAPLSTPPSAPTSAAPMAQATLPAAMPATARATATQAAVPLAVASAPAPAATPTAPGPASLLPALPSAAAVSAAATRPIVANVVILQSQMQPLPGVQMSPVASATNALLGQAVDGLRAPAAATTTLQPAVLLEPPTPSRDLLPARLAQTLRESGLFYEAHLARWGKGAYPFEALLNEPQARLGRAAMGMSLQELGGMPEEAARLAGRQLHMLEGQPFFWQGFAWPGQWMQWLVQEQTGWQDGSAEGEAADQWQTELRVTLPRMGSICVNLALRGQGVGLRLQADERATASALQAALPELQAGLEAAGLKVSGMQVTLASGEAL